MPFFVVCFVLHTRVSVYSYSPAMQQGPGAISLLSSSYRRPHCISYCCAFEDVMMPRVVCAVDAALYFAIMLLQHPTSHLSYKVLLPFSIPLTCVCAHLFPPHPIFSDRSLCGLRMSHIRVYCTCVRTTVNLPALLLHRRMKCNKSQNCPWIIHTEQQQKSTNQPMHRNPSRMAGHEMKVAAAACHRFTLRKRVARGGREIVMCRNFSPFLFLSLHNYLYNVFRRSISRRASSGSPSSTSTTPSCVSSSRTRDLRGSWPFWTTFAPRSTGSKKGQIK